MRTKLFILVCFLLAGCSHVFYQPSDVHYLEPLQFKLKYDDIFFQSKDGVKLHGWYFPTPQKKAKGTIVHFHGNAQNISTHFLSLAWMIKEGFNLFVFDYRGYGISEGSPSQKGVYNDAIAAISKGIELHQNQGLFVVYGQSLGGAISLRALADMDQSKIDLIVQDSTFSSYKSIGFDVLKRSWFTYIFSPLAFLLVSDEYASDKIISKITPPTLVVVSKKDQIVPKKFGKEIYRKLRTEKKWLWTLEDGQHIEIFHNGQEKWRVEFLKLLDGISQK